MTRRLRSSESWSTGLRARREADLFYAELTGAPIRRRRAPAGQPALNVDLRGRIAAEGRADVMPGVIAFTEDAPAKIAPWEHGCASSEDDRPETRDPERPEPSPPEGDAPACGCGQPAALRELHEDAAPEGCGCASARDHEQHDELHESHDPFALHEGGGQHEGDEIDAEDWGDRDHTIADGEAWDDPPEHDGFGGRTDHAEDAEADEMTASGSDPLVS